MVTLGLTGGVGSGKSTVAAWLTRQGARVLDADTVARDLVAPGSPGLAAVVARFGPEIVQHDGRLDRAQLGARVFANAAERAALNAILHPPIRQRMIDDLGLAARQGVPLAVIDAALLYEIGLERWCDAVLNVDCDERHQVERLRRRNGLDEAAALQRVRAQMSAAERCARADWTLDNRGSLDELAREIERVWREVRRRFPYATIAVED